MRAREPGAGRALQLESPGSSWPELAGAAGRSWPDEPGELESPGSSCSRGAAGRSRTSAAAGADREPGEHTCARTVRATCAPAVSQRDSCPAKGGGMSLAASAGVLFRRFACTMAGERPGKPTSPYTSRPSAREADEPGTQTCARTVRATCALRDRGLLKRRICIARCRGVSLMSAPLLQRFGIDASSIVVSYGQSTHRLSVCCRLVDHALVAISSLMSSTPPIVACFCQP